MGTQQQAETNENCGSCRGTGKTVKHMGLGSIALSMDCPSCDGSGLVSDKCLHCGGDGFSGSGGLFSMSASCKHCNGTGKR